MNKPQRIVHMFAHDFSGNPGSVVTKRNSYTFDQYEPNHSAWLRREDGVRGSLKITHDANSGASLATFAPAFFA